MDEDIKAQTETKDWKYKLDLTPSESAFISSETVRGNFDTEKVALPAEKRTATKDSDSPKLSQGWLRVKNKSQEPTHQFYLYRGIALKCGEIVTSRPKQTKDRPNS